jgi:hypothetical protein
MSHGASRITGPHFARTEVAHVNIKHPDLTNAYDPGELTDSVERRGVVCISFRVERRGVVCIYFRSSVRDSAE